MSLVKLPIPPGVYRNVTPYQGQARWYDVNLVRWVGEMLEPIGGWQRFSSTPVDGMCRGLFSWRDNSSYRWLAVGTSDKLYVHDDGSLFDITPTGFVGGLGTSLPGLGFGSLAFGDQEYGTERTGTSGLIVDAATWAFDTWGENLVACSTGDGKIYEWSLNTNNDAVAVVNAPVNNAYVMVSEQRHLIALGAGGDPRAISWSDAENNTVWTPTSANQAGSWYLNTQGHLKCGYKGRGEILLLTTTDAHTMRFIGSPLVFSFDRAGDGCGIAGPKAGAVTENGIVWFGTDAKFYLYNGVVQAVPCDVEDWIDVELDRLKLAEVYCGLLSEFGEVWWYFPAKDGTEKYVAWAYRTGVWTIGTLDRTAWLDRGVWRYPIAASSDGYLYQHEQGETNSGATRVGTIYAESSAMEIDPGERIMDIVQLLPDERTQGDVRVTLKCNYTPTGAETTYGPYLIRSDGYTDVRASGRQAKFRVEPVTDSDWRVGTFRADIKFAGMR